ncbi:hypothetical protein [Chitinophaga jiangningensis]|uniref:hypothetical protein n=1 Tax=Chitinophaga jiangningensis TaxID=1419482 RepID=UPI001160E27C|nr:hypothetical protein [Chitinophaga jiangningensis]
MYTEGTHAMGEVIRELNRTSLDIHYLVLQSNYINRQVMSSELLAVLKGWIKQGTVHVNDTLVMGSQIRLDQRAEELCAVIRQVVAS